MSVSDIGPYAFVDGSYNVRTKVYGCGGFVVADGERYEIKASGDDPEMASMRNVAGEILGAKLAVEKAFSLHLKSIIILYDYEGIEKWPLRLWKTNKKISMFYVSEYDGLKDKLKVNFVHVKAHTGIPGNEAADRMAKAEVGIE